MNLDDELLRSGESLREQTLASVDLDSALAETLTRNVADQGDDRLEPVAKRQHTILLVAACLAAVTATVGGLWLLTSDSTSDELVPAAPTSSDVVPATSAPSESTVPVSGELDQEFSAMSAFSALPASAARIEEATGDRTNRLVVQAADLGAVDDLLATERPSVGPEADQWLETVYSDSPGLSLTPPPFPPSVATASSSQARRDELGFDVIDLDSYATLSSMGARFGFFGVFRGTEVELSDRFVEVGGGLLSYGSGEDDHRNVDEISVIRPLGQPVRAAVTTGGVAISSSTTEVEAWQGGGDRLIDDPRMLAAAQSLDEFPLLEVQAYVMDFSVVATADAAEPTVITEPFSVLAVGTAVDAAGDLSTVVTYVFDDPEAATAARDGVESAWHQPSTLGEPAPADFYQTIDVAHVGRTVVVTAPLDASTSSSKWLEFLLRGEAVFTHAPDESTEVSVADPSDAACGAADECVLYSIQSGDYPVLVAETFCISLVELSAANGWRDLNVDFPGPGTTIVIPSFEDRSSCPDPTEPTVAVGVPNVDGGMATAASVSATPDGVFLGDDDFQFSPLPIDDVPASLALLIDDVVVFQGIDSSFGIDRRPAGPIYVIGETGRREFVHSDDRRLTLHDVGHVDRRAVILASSETVLPVGFDDAEHDLLLIDVETFVAVRVGSFGGWESGVRHARFAGDAIALHQSESTHQMLEVIEIDGSTRFEEDLGRDGSLVVTVADDDIWVVEAAFVGDDFDPMLTVTIFDSTTGASTSSQSIIATDGEPITGGFCTTADVRGRTLICDQDQGEALMIDIGDWSATPIRGTADSRIMSRAAR